MLEQILLDRFRGLVLPRRERRNGLFQREFEALLRRASAQGRLGGGLTIEVADLAEAELRARAKEWRTQLERVITDRHVELYSTIAADMKDALRKCLKDDQIDIVNALLPRVNTVQAPHEAIEATVRNALDEENGEIDLFVDRRSTG